MVSAGDFRNGVTFEMDGDVYQIIEFQHVKPGKGAAFVRTKIRNVIAGSVLSAHSTPRKNSPPLILSARRWSIPITMAIFIISWIPRAMSSSR